MKNWFGKTLALALLALTASAPAHAKAVNPITDWRRTLFASLGQHMLVFEAPVGMCFLDESDYLEGTILKHVRDITAAGGSKLIGTFADCMEIARIRYDYQEQINANPTGNTAPAPQLMTLKSRGNIFWINPGTGEDDVDMVRTGYLDAREKSFRDDVMKALKNPLSGLTMVSLMASPNDYKFDDASHRSDAGLSLAYSVNSEIEYQAVYTAGVVGTTLIRHIPLEFSFDFSTKAPDKDNKRLYAMMDAFMAQQVVLNNQMANQ